MAVDDVISYLAGSIEREPQGVLDIGCEDLTFAEMVVGYSTVRGLRRHIHEFPLVKPSLCASLVGMLTPVPRQLAAPLLEGVDELAGGPGLRRGRRDPEELEVGEAMDVWRVVKVEPPHKLQLQAEMLIPGRAWLEFQALPEESGCRLVITATMEPKGVWGWLYWWGTFPFHRLGFLKLARVLAREAESSQRIKAR